MKTIRVMNSYGDSPLTFDETDQKAAEEAEAAVQKMLREGRLLFDVSHGDGRAKKVLRASDVETEGLVVPIVTSG